MTGGPAREWLYYLQALYDRTGGAQGTPGGIPEAPQDGGTYGRNNASWVHVLTANQTITLSGDVTGSGATAITTTTVRLQGRPVASTAPAINQVLQWNGTAWAPATTSAGSSGTVTSITAGTGLSGGTITTTGTIALANTAVTAASYTYASLTVNAQGQITAASSGAAPASPATVAPIMDGTAAVGTSALYARQDHVHPTDTSRYAASNPAGYISGNQTITLSGDASGSGATAITTTLATVNSNVGTFQGLTVSAKGLVTAASNQNYVNAAGAAAAAPVQSVAGRTGAVTLTHSDITDWTASLAPYAPLASPVFTGTPSLPTGTTGITQTAGTNNTSLATTAYVTAAISALPGGGITSVTHDTSLSGAGTSASPLSVAIVDGQRTLP